MAAEAINTSIEELCDRVCTSQDSRIKRSKDAAAGAVLILAFFAAVIGAVLFSDPQGWKAAFEYYTGSAVRAAMLAVLSVLSVVFIVITPKKNRKEKKK